MHPVKVSLWLLSVLLAALAGSCADRPASDSCCDYVALRAGSPPPDGLAVLHVEGSTGASYTVVNAAGERVASARLNESVSLPPGSYALLLNTSNHQVTLDEGMKVRCATGTVIVSGDTDDRYHVTDSSTTRSSEVLSTSMSLFPGYYRIAVNNTHRQVEIRPRELTELRSGTLTVWGDTGETYYVLDQDNRQLGYNTLGKPLALLPGRYQVKVNNTSTDASIYAGQHSECRTGSLLVTGLTDEYYYVSDTLDRALNYQTLNRPLALLPGAFTIKVNNTELYARVAPDSTSTFETGSLTLTGVGSEYYYVLDTAGRQLNYTSFNRPLSFFPSEYTVKLGNTLRKATVRPGTRTALEAFH